MDPSRVELEALLADRQIHPVYQPIVDLGSGETVGFEALARGPEGSPLRTPDRLFACAREVARLDDLDQLCQARAVECAADSAIAGPLALFVNVEPAAVTSALFGPSPTLQALRDRGVALVVEITERALTDDPARLLAYAERAHEEGWSIALDDVGAKPESLALMPFLRPDVVKLDLRLVQAQPDDAVAETMTAVTAYAERSGALILAEGIETARHEEMARSLGATLGQGWRYGRPGPLLPPPSPPRHPLGLLPFHHVSRRRSPFDAAALARPPLRATKSLLIAISKLLERQARGLAGAAVVLSTFEDSRYLTPSTVERYAELGRSAAFVVTLGAGVSTEPVPGVRGGDLDPSDPLVGEWDVVVVGPHFAAALVALDLRDDRVPDLERTFDYVLTYDREVVLDVARALMARVLPLDFAVRGDLVPEPG